VILTGVESVVMGSRKTGGPHSSIANRTFLRVNWKNTVMR